MDELTRRAAVGLATLPVPAEVRERALSGLEAWLAHPEHAAHRLQLESWVRRGAFSELADAFHQLIPFGTGGRRGRVGIGPNRMNPTTVAASVQGHVAWLRRHFSEPIEVVLAYDVRRFTDQGGRYNRELPNPLIGLTSRDLAELAARVYVANGVGVWMQPRGDTRYLATPELSLLIRYLGAQAGLNISASHNPPDDNGAKFYNHLGGQAIPPHDQALIDEVARVGEVRRCSWEDASEQISWLGPAHHEAYLAAVLAASRRASPGMKVVFTALHGVGGFTVAEALESAGVDVLREPEQCVPDGAFPTVPYGVANPEVVGAMARAVAYAETEGVPLVLAADPDADRIGCAVHHHGSWRYLSGNQIAALVVDHALQYARTERPIVMQTQVTSGFVARMARARGAQVVDHLLVGFKYIGDGLDQLERTGSFGGAHGTVADFAAGVEESHGVLVTPAIRDKDAAGGALYLVEAAARAAEREETLVDVLCSLERTHGLVVNSLRSVVMEGAVGRLRIEAMLDGVRREPPAALAGLSLERIDDRRDPKGPLGPWLSATDAAARNVLVLDFGASAQLVLRPSGTEPKVKLYVEVRGHPGEDPDHARPRLEALTRALEEALLLELLRRVELPLPAWALAASDLLTIEAKRALVEHVLPALQRRETLESSWVEALLARHGIASLELVWEALARAPGGQSVLETLGAR